MDQPPAVAFTAFAGAWPRAIETEIGAALCATGAGKDFDVHNHTLKYNGIFKRKKRERKRRSYDI